MAEMRMINEMVKKESEFIESVFTEVEKVIVGQKYMIERIFMGLLTGGHILIEGVPGLAKTLTIRTFSRIINTAFQRIQFTPDLLPSDIIGTMIYNQKTGDFVAKKGPIFANLILADEINRAPAKVQSALLEAMQEKQVTLSDQTWKLEEPFIVMATQNPIEQEGTYPLPEAQVDRFMFKIMVDYPNKDEEFKIINRAVSDYSIPVNKVIDPKKLLEAREVVKQIYVDEQLKRYIVDLIDSTRNPADYKMQDIASYIRYGASPRATIYLYQAAKAMAFLKHRGYVMPDDIKSVGADVLRHRILLTYEAEAEEITPEDIIRKIFDSVEVP